MDPFSITVGCISLINAVADASSLVNRFVKTYRETRSDLAALSSQLDELQRVLDIVKHDDSPGEAITQLAFEKSKEQVNKCMDILETLPKVLEEYKQPRGSSLQWAWRGKKRVDAIWLEIGKVIDHFKLTLGIYTSSLTRDIKDDTSAILDGQAAILARLDALREGQGSSTPRGDVFMRKTAANPPKYTANRQDNTHSLSLRDAVFWQPDDEGWDCSYTNTSSVAGSEDEERDYSSANYGPPVPSTADCVNSINNEALQHMEVYRSDISFAMPPGPPELFYQTKPQIQLASTSSADILREQSYASQTLYRASKGDTGGLAPLQAENEADEKKRVIFRETVLASVEKNRAARRRSKQSAATQTSIKKIERDERIVKTRAKFKEMVQAKAMRPG